MEFYTAGSPLLKEYIKLLSPELTPCGHLKIGPEDALIVVDMQNDFVPFHTTDNPFGGQHGVSEGQAVVQPIAWLMREAFKAKATVVATRAYHPADHCSFMTQNGHFPPHCVQGTKGADIVDTIADTLAQCRNAWGPRQGHEKVQVAFKAFHEDVDSLGGLPYTPGAVYKEGGHWHKSYAKCPMGCTATPWTGCMILKQSALIENSKTCQVCSGDFNSAPDLLAMESDRKRGSIPLQEALKDCKRIFACGLALDFGVLDTCINAKANEFGEVYMILDAARASHVLGIGEFGTGFLSDPAKVLTDLQEAGVQISCLEAVAGHPLPSRVAPEIAEADDFPKALNPMGLLKVTDKMTVDVDTKTCTYEFKQGKAGQQTDALSPIRELGVGLKGRISQPFKIVEGWPGAPRKAAYLCRAYPLDDTLPREGERGTQERSRTAELEARSKAAFLNIMATPALLFAAYGGFLLLEDKEGKKVVGMQAFCDGGLLCFDEVKIAPVEVAQKLEASHRLIPEWLPSLLHNGADKQCWLHADEKIGTWKVKDHAPHGAFFYTIKGSPEPIFFPLMNLSSCHQNVGEAMREAEKKYCSGSMEDLVGGIITECLDGRPKDGADTWKFVLEYLEKQQEKQQQEQKA